MLETLLGNGSFPRFKGWRLIRDDLFYHNFGNGAIVKDHLYMLGNGESLGEILPEHKTITVIDLRTFEERQVSIPNGIFSRAAACSNGVDKIYAYGGYNGVSTDNSNYLIFAVDGFNITQLAYRKLGDSNTNYRTNSASLTHFDNGSKSVNILTGGTPIASQNRTLLLNTGTTASQTVVSGRGYIRHTGTFVYKGKLYEVGGYDDTTPPAPARKDIYVFTPNSGLTSGTWAKWGNLPGGRVRPYFHVVEETDTVYLFGGGTNMGNTVSANAWPDPETYMLRINMLTKEITNVPMEWCPSGKRWSRQFVHDGKLIHWQDRELWVRWIDDLLV